MLLSSILQILNQFSAQPQPQPIEKTEAKLFEKAMTVAMEKEFGPKAGESESESAAPELSIPSMLRPVHAVPKQSLEELIRAVTKFEKPEQGVFDIFQ
jgi:hypothetical protein